MDILKAAGYRCEKVERWIPGAGIRKDFLGCIDIIAIRAKKKKLIGLQVFTTAWMEHKRKICDEYPDGARLWLECGHQLYFIGWRKLKVKRGGKAFRWVPRFGKVKAKKKKLVLIEVQNPWNTK